MPNIEIHGVEHKNGFDLTIRIGEAIKRSFPEIAADIVITEIPSTCHDLNGKNFPFLRICDTDPKRAEKVAKALETFDLTDDYDIEILELKRFYPKAIQPQKSTP